MAIDEKQWNEFLSAVEEIIKFWFQGPTAYKPCNDRLATIRALLPRLKRCSVIEWERATKDADLPLEDLESVNDYLIFDELCGETAAGDLGSICKNDLFAPMPTPPKTIDL